MSQRASPIVPSPKSRTTHLVRYLRADTDPINSSPGEIPIASENGSPNISPATTASPSIVEIANPLVVTAQQNAPAGPKRLFARSSGKVDSRSYATVAKSTSVLSISSSSLPPSSPIAIPSSSPSSIDEATTNVPVRAPSKHSVPNNDKQALLSQVPSILAPRQQNGPQMASQIAQTVPPMGGASTTSPGQPPSTLGVFNSTTTTLTKESNDRLADHVLGKRLWNGTPPPDESARSNRQRTNVFRDITNDRSHVESIVNPWLSSTRALAMTPDEAEDEVSLPETPTPPGRKRYPFIDIPSAQTVLARPPLPSPYPWTSASNAAGDTSFFQDMAQIANDHMDVDIDSPPRTKGKQKESSRDTTDDPNMQRACSELPARITTAQQPPRPISHAPITKTGPSTSVPRRDTPIPALHIPVRHNNTRSRPLASTIASAHIIPPPPRAQLLNPAAPTQPPTAGSCGADPPLQTISEHELLPSIVYRSASLDDQPASPPVEGWPTVHRDDPESLLNGLSPNWVEAIWKDPPHTVVLVEPFNQKLSTSVRHNRLLAMALKSAVTTITGELEFQIIPPEPEHGINPKSKQAPTVWALRGLPNEAVHRLAEGRVWSLHSISFFAYPRSLDIPRWLLCLEGFVDDDQTAIEQTVDSVLYAPYTYNCLADMVRETAGDISYSGLLLRVQEVLNTLEVVVSKLGNGNIVANIYMNPPTRNREKWREWVGVLRKTRFGIYLTAMASPRPIKYCDGCRSTDHPTHCCPFPKLQGWKGPPAGNGRYTLIEPEPEKDTRSSRASRSRANSDAENSPPKPRNAADGKRGRGGRGGRGGRRARGRGSRKLREYDD